MQGPLNSQVVHLDYRQLADLGRPEVRLAMPNPEFEGIARQIKASPEHAGGDKLLSEVYGAKVAGGSTVLTHIHHRQTPLWIMQGNAQAGVTWQSEAMFHEQIGHPVSHVDIPAAREGVAAANAMNASNTRVQWVTLLSSLGNG